MQNSLRRQFRKGFALLLNSVMKLMVLGTLQVLRPMKSQYLVLKKLFKEVQCAFFGLGAL